MTEPIRYNKDTEEFEYRCESCLRKNVKAWWPLTLEFWSPYRGMTRCHACHAEYKAKVMRDRRANDPEYKQRCVQQTREARKVKGRIYYEQSTRGQAKLNRSRSRGETSRA